MIKLLLAVVVLYLGGYAGVRHVMGEVDGGVRYVVFPDNDSGRLMYQAWRPLIVLDEEYTGTRTSVGRRRGA